MKILLVCNYFQPKLSYAESEIARALLSLGHSVEVITGDRYFPFPNYEKTVQSVLGTRLVGTSKKKENGIFVTRQKVYFEFFARSGFFGIYQKIKSFRPNYVIVFGLTTPASIQVSLFKNNSNFKFVGVDSHLPSELFSSQVVLKKAFYFVFRLLFSNLINKKIDKIIAVQEGTKGVIKKYYGLNKKIVLASHGTNTELFHFDPLLRTKVRKHYNINEKDFLIIYTGKIIESKGIDILIKAFENLCLKYKNVYLLLVGSGPLEYKETCLNIATENTKMKIIWEEFKNYKKLPAYYSASDVAVWPLQESLSMNDAAACSLPYIVNHTAGVKERLSNNNALLYKKGDSIDLSKKIEYLYLNSDQRKKMGKNGRELVENNLSWQKVAKKYLL
ncbi:MAG: hypothetical protein BroJett025_04990 [Patescibacteria group bacterium]|nr:MAG: hypothetical protein BroJett025_04990 [Patescibacteria group bacterium]